MLRYQQRPQKQDNNFMYFVQLHERIWGMESYAKRPPLADILKADGVISWQVEDQKDRYKISLHHALADVEAYFARMLFRNQVNKPSKRVVRIFYQHKRLIINGVKIDFRQVDE